MLNKERNIAVELVVTGEPVDMRLIKSLNYFHFQTIKLVTNVNSNKIPYKLHYNRQSSQPGNSEIRSINPKRKSAYLYLDDKKNRHSSLTYLSKDYISAIEDHFLTYINTTSKVYNKKSLNNSSLPIVDQLSDDFEEEIVKGLNLHFKKQKKRFYVISTHDVDVLGKSRLASLKSSVVFLANFFRSIYACSFSTSLFYLRQAFRFFLGIVDYNGFPLILRISAAYGFSPTFFLFSFLDDNKNNLSFSERLLQRNPNYHLNSSELSFLFNEIGNGRIEIGIHGSYNSANNTCLLGSEKKRLEDFIRQKCVSIRQHYLRFFGKTSHDIYSDLGFLYESNCGFVQENGFFCSTTRPFYTKLKSRKSQNDVVCIPMVFMDAVPLYFNPKHPSAVFQDLKGIIQQVKEYGGTVALNFHQRMISAIREYGELFEKSIVYIKEEGGDLIRFSDLDNIIQQNSRYDKEY